MRLRVSAKAAEQLGGRYAYKTDEEKAAERVAREKASAERTARDRLAREEKERKRIAARKQVKAERAEADRVDEVLRSALDEFRKVEKAVDPREREIARLEVEDTLRVLNGARDAIASAQAKCSAAEAKHARAKIEHEAMEALSNEKLPTAKAKLEEVWSANDALWRKMTQQYRKANRDRELKNSVKDILGLKNGAD